MSAAGGGPTAGVRIGAMVRRLDDERSISIDPDLVLRLASVGKVLLLGEVARRLADGTLAADQPVELLDPDREVGGTGLLGQLSPRWWTVADLATAVAAVSDNAATNALLRLVTLDAVQGPGPPHRPAGHDRARSHPGRARPRRTEDLRDRHRPRGSARSSRTRRPEPGRARGRARCYGTGSPETPTAPWSPTPSATTPGRATTSGC